MGGAISGTLRAPQEEEPVKLALFDEIPVARPWTKDEEHRAFDGSNPVVLTGAIAARTRKLRIGYGVRVELGTGRSSTRCSR